MIVLDCNIFHASHIPLAFSPEFFYRWCHRPWKIILKKSFLGFFEYLRDKIFSVAVIVA